MSQRHEERGLWCNPCRRCYHRLHAALPDADDVFSYDTVKEVRLLDRRLGYVYYLFGTAVFMYIVIVVFIIKKQYLETEKSMGQILTKVMRPMHTTTGLPWDIFDSVTNPGENGAVFVPTRIVVTKGQTQEEPYCPSPVHPCDTAADCDIGSEFAQKSECFENKCMRRQWCPAEDPEMETSVTHYLNTSTTELWFETYVHFHKFFIDVTTTDEESSIVYPSRSSNTYAIHDLVRMANLDKNEVVNNGAIIIANAIFECDLGARTCKRWVETANVDTKTGFNYVHNRYYWENGVRKRDSYRMYGLRFITFATGIGLTMSVSQVILQISSAIALLGVSSNVADFVLEYLLPERRHYMEQKLIETEDFHP